MFVKIKTQKIAYSLKESLNEDYETKKQINESEFYNKSKNSKIPKLFNHF